MKTRPQRIYETHRQQMNICPVCGKPYQEFVSAPDGGFDYVHKRSLYSIYICHVVPKVDKSPLGGFVDETGPAEEPE